ncbi:Intracellular proteinase inhibitor [Selenomonas ruminantium]|uniref:Intracellular proteinase inhibitor n=1 Tax=Selenomonas ruminantium TaxID=971 RepID=A0A1M6XI94_SELRU|nr:BsuPI-related putative proteinase inhibitor [Selenomonas ruminantium]SHL05702.1 Intracellular proteinase inhibitor [Selenomonas ruminantium]
MRQILIPIILASCLLTPTVAHAGFGTGIGITFPASGSSTKTPINTYAALQFEQITEELTLQERHGRLLMELKVCNNGDAPYTISHRDGQVYDFLITDKNGKKIWQWSDGMAFTQALCTTTIAPHSFEVYKAELNSKDYRKIKDDAILATAFLLDTPCKLSAKLPTTIASNSTPVLIHGGVIFGNRAVADDQ